MTKSITDRLQALRQAVADSSMTQVGQRIGVSRTAISLVLSGNYGADIRHVLDKFDATYSTVTCPYLQAALSREQCRAFATKARPSNPLGLAHWKACQQCDTSCTRTPGPQ